MANMECAKGMADEIREQINLLETELLGLNTSFSIDIAVNSGEVIDADRMAKEAQQIANLMSKARTEINLAYEMVVQNAKAAD